VGFHVGMEGGGGTDELGQSFVAGGEMFVAASRSKGEWVDG